MFFIFFSPRLGSMSKISYRVFRDFLIRSTFFSNLGGTQGVAKPDFGLEGIGCIFTRLSFVIVLSNKVKHTGDVSSLQVPISSLQGDYFHWKQAIFGLFWLGKGI